MRLAFLLVLSLVTVGIARGDFASGEARSEEAAPLRIALRDSAETPLAEPDSAQQPSPEAPAVRSAVEAALSRLRDAAFR